MTKVENRIKRGPFQSTADIRAWMNGRTQFRVPVVPQPINTPLGAKIENGELWWELNAPRNWIRDDEKLPYAVGDVVWFPEAWRCHVVEVGCGDGHIEYQSDGGIRQLSSGEELSLLPSTFGNIAKHLQIDPHRWRSPATMAEWAARIRKEIVGVRVEQDDDGKWVFVYDTKEADDE